MKLFRMKRRSLGVPRATVVVLIALATIGASAAFLVTRPVDAAPWMETFDGTPSHPTAWSSPNWDIQYHVRDSWRWQEPAGMEAQHGASCSAPPEMHHVDTWTGTVFQCNGHVMTTSPGHGYGMIYLTPNRLVDFSSGPAVVQWDMSTEDTNKRDWPSVTITPWEWNQAVTLMAGSAQGTDLQGRPRHGLEVNFELNSGSSSVPHLVISNEGRATEYVGRGTMAGGIAPGTNQAAARQTFKLTVSKDHVRFERLASETASAIVYIDQSIADLGWTSGVVQFGHHAYDPEKDSSIQTWHWDNASIAPSVPFTMIKTDRRSITTSNAAGEVLNLAEPAPANSYLRFAAVGTPYISVNNGPFVAATKQWERSDIPQHASSYWHPIPRGTTAVKIRMGSRGWYNGPYIARDFSVWSRSTSAGEAAATRTPASGSTATPVPPTPTNTAVPGRTRTPSPIPTATATPTPTRTTVPTQTAVPNAWTTSARVSSRSVSPGSTQYITGFFRPSRAGSALIDVEVYDPSGRRVQQGYWDRQAFQTGQERSFHVSWRVPANARKGTYTVKLGVFNPGWNGLIRWNDSAVQFTVR